MSTRMTIETILRDADDCSGQTIRSWKIEVEPHHVILRMNHGDGFVLLRTDDIQRLQDDLNRAKQMVAGLRPRANNE